MSALQFDVGAERKLHPGQPGQLGRLVDRLRAFYVPVDFLQRDQVRLYRSDDARDPLHVQLAVDAFGMMDVVAEDAQPQRFGCFRRDGR